MHGPLSTKIKCHDFAFAIIKWVFTIPGIKIWILLNLCEFCRHYVLNMPSPERNVFVMFSGIDRSIANGESLERSDSVQLRCYFFDVNLGWIRSYTGLPDKISHSEQKIQHDAEMTMTICGVPRGSALGPLLFTHYTTDISDFVGGGVRLNSYANDNQVDSSCYERECTIE